MGFLSNIFKKKEGGTKIGNLFRGVSSTLTGGILGSGAGLAKSDQEFAEMRQQEAMRQFMATAPPLSTNGYKEIGQNLASGTLIPAMTNGQGTTSPLIGQQVFKETMKKNWYWLVLALSGFGFAVYYFATKNNKKRR